MHAEVMGAAALELLNHVSAADLSSTSALSVVVVADVPRMLVAVRQLAGAPRMPSEPRLTEPAHPPEQGAHALPTFSGLALTSFCSRGATSAP
jgi:hypothetical protein